MRPTPWRGLRTLVPLLLAVLVPACGSVSGSDPRGQVLVVDAMGAPLKGAVVLPDPEYQSGAPPNYSASELVEHSTNAQGVILVYLDDFFWSTDGCYHFRVRRAGFEDETMTVSKDLFPAVLKIDMRPRVPPTVPAPPGRQS